MTGARGYSNTQIGSSQFAFRRIDSFLKWKQIQDCGRPSNGGEEVTKPDREKASSQGGKSHTGSKRSSIKKKNCARNGGCVVVWKFQEVDVPVQIPTGKDLCQSSCLQLKGKFQSE